MNLQTLRKQQMSPNYLLNHFISTLTFTEVGIVHAIYAEGKRIDVRLPYKQADNQDAIIANVELLQCGNATASIFIMPKVGDTVLLFNPHTSIPTLQAEAEPTTKTIGDYNLLGAKALLVQGVLAQDPDVTITINGTDPLTINGKTDVSINGHLVIKGAS